MPIAAILLLLPALLLPPAVESVEFNALGFPSVCSGPDWHRLLCCSFEICEIQGQTWYPPDASSTCGVSCENPNRVCQCQGRQATEQPYILREVYLGNTIEAGDTLLFTDEPAHKINDAVPECAVAGCPVNTLPALPSQRRIWVYGGAFNPNIPCANLLSTDGDGYASPLGVLVPGGYQRYFVVMKADPECGAPNCNDYRQLSVWRHGDSGLPLHTECLPGTPTETWVHACANQVDQGDPSVLTRRKKQLDGHADPRFGDETGCTTNANIWNTDVYRFEVNTAGSSATVLAEFGLCANQADQLYLYLFDGSWNPADPSDPFCSSAYIAHAYFGSSTSCNENDNFTAELGDGIYYLAVIPYNTAGSANYPIPYLLKVVELIPSGEPMISLDCDPIDWQLEPADNTKAVVSWINYELVEQEANQMLDDDLVSLSARYYAEFLRHPIGCGIVFADWYAGFPAGIVNNPHDFRYMLAQLLFPGDPTPPFTLSRDDVDRYPAARTWREASWLSASSNGLQVTLHDNLTYAGSTPVVCVPRWVSAVSSSFGGRFPAAPGPANGRHGYSSSGDEYFQITNSRIGAEGWPIDRTLSPRKCGISSSDPVPWHCPSKLRWRDATPYIWHVVQFDVLTGEWTPMPPNIDVPDLFNTFDIYEGEGYWATEAVGIARRDQSFGGFWMFGNQDASHQIDLSQYPASP